MKKHLLILFPLMALLLAGCSGGGGEQTTTSGDAPTSSSPATSVAPPSSGPAPSENHLIGISWDGVTQDFVTSVGGSQRLKIKYEGGSSTSAIPEEEKGINWTTSNSSIATIPDDDHDNSIDVSFVSAGSVKITATSTYNSDYTKSLNITVYPNDEYHYVWNCASGDKDKFSAAEGDAVLNGNTWHYLRAKPSESAVTGSQSLKFGGKNSSEKPSNNEGAFTLTLNNTKVVKQIIVSTSSGARPTGVDDQGHETTERYGSSKLTMTVGATTYYPETATPKGDTPESVNSTIPTTLASGNIVLSFTESYSYLCLKSIIVIYDHSLSEIVVSPTSPHKVLFQVGETFSAEGLVVYAHYVNDPGNYDVTSRCNIVAPNLETQGVKTVNITFSEGGVSKLTSYQVEVNPVRNVVSVAITGSIAPGTKYYVGDTVDYSALKVLITWDAVDIHDSLTSELPLPTSNGGDFTDVTNVYETAVLDMSSAYDISLKYKNVLADKHFDAGTFEVIELNVNFDFGRDGEGDWIISDIGTWGTTVANKALVDSSSRVHLSGGFRVSPADASYPTSACSKPIYLTLDDTEAAGFAIDKIEVDFVKYSTEGAQLEFKVASSVLRGEPYGAELISVNGWNNGEMRLEFSNFEKGTNAVKIYYSSTSSTTHFDLKKIHIVLREEVNFNLDSFIMSGTPTKTKYKFGFEQFDPTGITVLAKSADSEYEDIDVTSAVSWSALEVGADTTVTGTIRTTDFEVEHIEVVAPNAIRIEGTPEVTQYNAGDQFNTAGITVYADFPNESGLTSEDITNSDKLSWDALIASEPGAGFATCHYVDTGVNLNGTVSGLTVAGYSGNLYTKVSKMPDSDDLSGTYLIYSDAAHLIVNGALTTQTAMKDANHLTETISTASYTATTANIDAAVFAITKVSGDRYTVKSVATNKYLGLDDDGEVKYGSNEYSFSITFDASGNAVMTNKDRAGVTSIKYLGLKASTSKLGGYASASTNPIQLYKLSV